MRNKTSRLETVTAGDVKEIINIYRFVANIYTSFERMTCKSPDDVLTKLRLEGKFQFNGISGERESINISYNIKTGFKVVLDMESLSRNKDSKYFKLLSRKIEFERRATDYLRRRYANYDEPIVISDLESC